MVNEIEKSRLLEQSTKITGIENLTVGDFWSWAYSDILSNLNRSVFAEFIVASTLEIVDKPRIEWDAVDLRFQGKGIEIAIEVKVSAYLQSWPQKGLSKITFDIEKKKSWDAKTNTYNDKAKRSADCYVFCLYKEKTSTKIEKVLNLLNWEFYVVSTDELNEKFKDQKSVGLKGIQKISEPVDYGKLKEEIVRAVKTIQKKQC